ncbi:MAG TPA: pyridoxal phosphate-dependent aminotransferase [Fibrobacteria bacterium]|nr:pyridoxal phosphate-dependent aminotransferase [Fibrobacteria bacterium]
MRRPILHVGAGELVYEIREIVKKAQLFQKLGVEIFWENIGDPVAKGTPIPAWMKKIVAGLAEDSQSYAYCSTKGVLETRQFLASRTNSLGGVQITPEDILFTNGLGDAISKVYQYLDPGARVLGPSPGYSTHSSAEGGHAGQPPITYCLLPERSWLPDMEELRNRVRYNPSIVGILIINPDNPTGMVYPEKYLREVVEIAKEYDLFLIADEIYTHITYNGAKAIPLAAVIGDVCGISMKGISKELPWPGSRCGWLEFYNTSRDAEFSRLVKAIEDAKMLEVCSTTLPQMAIPAVLSHPEFQTHRNALNLAIQKRGDVVFDTLKDVPELIVNKTQGAFYTSIIFKKGVLKPTQKLKVENAGARALVEKMVEGVPLDKRFVYYVLAATGICVVPISSFCSDLHGFRVTLLEEDPKRMVWMYQRLKAAIEEYLRS